MYAELLLGGAIPTVDEELRLAGVSRHNGLSFDRTRKRVVCTCGGLFHNLAPSHVMRKTLEQHILTHKKKQKIGGAPSTAASAKGGAIASRKSKTSSIDSWATPIERTGSVFGGAVLCRGRQDMRFTVRRIEHDSSGSAETRMVEFTAGRDALLCAPVSVQMAGQWEAEPLFNPARPAPPVLRGQFSCNVPVVMQRTPTIGTVRSADCTRVISANPAHRTRSDLVTCRFCLKLEQNPHVIDRVVQYSRGRPSKFVPHHLCSYDEVIERLREKVLEQRKDSLERLHGRRTNTILERRIQKWNRALDCGSFGRMFASTIERISKLPESKFLKISAKTPPPWLKSIMTNLGKDPNGMRYNDGTMAFYDAIYCRYGANAAKFMGENFFGPAVRTIQRRASEFHRNGAPPGSPLQLRLTTTGEPDFNDPDWDVLFAFEAKRLKEEMATLRMKAASVPCVHCVDETRIQAGVFYVPDSRRVPGRQRVVVGSCGPLGHSRCTLGEEYMVKSGETAYDEMMEYLESSHWGDYLSVSMINPMHPRLKAFPVFYFVTCNKFKKELCHTIKKKIDFFFRKHLSAVIGPLVSYASDGDSRRRALQLDYSAPERSKLVGIDRPRASDPDTRRFLSWNPHPLQFLPFSATLYWDCSLNLNIVECICDQDYRHNLGKWVNLMDSASRYMHIGGYRVLLWVIREVVIRCGEDRWSHPEHGEGHGPVPGLDPRDRPRVTKVALDRKHRMDKVDVQMIIQPKLVKAIWAVARERRMNEASDDPHYAGRWTGTLLYIHVGYRYSRVYFHPRRSLADRAEDALYSLYFVTMWRDWHKKSPGVTLKEHFVTRETYTDVTLSCCAYLELLIFFRDMEYEFYPFEMGSDANEVFFAELATFRAGKRVIDIRDVERVMAQGIRMRSAGRPVKMPNHVYKSEFFDEPASDEPLEDSFNPKAYPTDTELKVRAKKALADVQRDLKLCGLEPGPEANPAWRWFYKPDHRGTGAAFATEMLSEDQYDIAEAGLDENNTDPNEDIADETVQVIESIVASASDDSAGVGGGADNAPEDLPDDPPDAGAGSGGSGTRASASSARPGLATGDYVLKRDSVNQLFYRVQTDRAVTEWAKIRGIGEFALSSDKYIRIQNGRARSDWSATQAQGDAEHGASLVTVGGTALLLHEGREKGTHKVWLADLDMAVRTTKSGKCKMHFAYVMRGACRGVTTAWSYWRKLDKNGQPLPGNGDDLAVDLNDPNVRYTRTRLVAESATIEVGRDADQSLLPVLRGVIMDPCDPTQCCGICFRIPFDVLADVRQAVYGLGETETASWSQCDNCGKWRKNQGGAPPPDPDAPFRCTDDWRMTTCDDPQEPFDENDHDVVVYEGTQRMDPMADYSGSEPITPEPAPDFPTLI